MRSTPAEKYSAGQHERQHYIDRARDHAKVTIPSLFTDSSHSTSERLYTPYQSMGARGVNNLSSKLLLSLFQPNTPFFKLTVDEMTAAELAGEEAMKTEIDEALAKIERKLMHTLETSTIRTAIFEAIKHLVVTGNVMLHIADPRNVRVFTLDQFVIRRAPEGKLLEAVIEEIVPRDDLPDDVAKRLMEGEGKSLPSNEPAPSDKKDAKGRMGKVDEVSLFTHIWWDGDRYKTRQCVNDFEIPGTQGVYPEDKLPYLPLRFVKVDGENYGRSYVEEYYGDLYSLETLYQSMADVAALMARVVFLNDPAGTTSSDDIIDARSGQVVDGRQGDVSVLQVEKFGDLQYIKGLADDIQQRLGFAFLMNTAVQRNGERVTAQEIRFMAQELEDVLGGVYSVLAQELQLPLVKLLMHQLSKSGDIPKLPKQIQPMITTGLEALGRGHDLNKLDTFIAGIGQALGPEVLQRYINVGNYLTRRGTALGIAMDGLVRSDEEVQQQVQQEQQMQMMEKMMGPGAGLAGKAMEVAQRGNQEGNGGEGNA